MVSPGWLKRLLEKNDFTVFEWDKDQKQNYLNVPNEVGVYALYWGESLRYIGRAANLRRRLSQWDSEDYYGTDKRIPFGSFAWFTLPEDEYKDAEALLILYYDPPYNVQYPSLSFSDKQ